MADRTVTRAIETDLEADVILAILKDPRLIPRWAPAFADTVEADTKNRRYDTAGGRRGECRGGNERPHSGTQAAGCSERNGFVINRFLIQNHDHCPFLGYGRRRSIRM